jgi:multiple sugar transport system ATP-binding protein
MSDRIAIMNHGKLQQFGTPDEVYYQPANVFVAGFIGSPPMNFIDGEILHDNGSDYFTRGALRYPMPPRLVQRLQERGRTSPVILGVRPETIGVSHAGPGIAGTVYVEEPLGSDVFLTVEVEKANIIVRTDPEFRANFGEQVHLTFNPQKVYLFDQKSGEAIR